MGMEAFYYLNIPLTIIGVMGLFGYAYKRRILKPDFWKYYFFVTVVWQFPYGFYFFKNEVELIEFMNQNPIAAIIIAVICFGICLPAYIAIYLYGFRSKDLWDRDTH